METTCIEKKKSSKMDWTKKIFIKKPSWIQKWIRWKVLVQLY